MKTNLPLTAVLTSCLLAGSASAQILSENFETDTTANWTVNVSSGGQGRADFFFDYSTVGIPQSPNSTGSDTRAMKLEANWSANVFGGLSVSPTGYSLPNEFVLKFDFWTNYVGPLDLSMPGAGNGSTMLSGFGIGTAGTTAQWGDGYRDSLHFDLTGDGDSAQDYRVYPNAGRANGVKYLAAVAEPDPNKPSQTIGPEDNRNSYYAGFGNVEAPAAQISLYPEQIGKTAIGTAGMAWHEMTITKTGDTVTWHMNGLLMATVENYSSLNVGGNNILFNRYDSNSGSSTAPNGEALNFTLIDNIMVIPEPSTYAAIFGGLALLGAFLHRRRKN